MVEGRWERRGVVGGMGSVCGSVGGIVMDFLVLSEAFIMADRCESAVGLTNVSNAWPSRHNRKRNFSSSIRTVFVS